MRIGLFIPCFIDAFAPEVGVATLEPAVPEGQHVVGHAQTRVVSPPGARLAPVDRVRHEHAIEKVDRPPGLGRRQETPGSNGRIGAQAGGPLKDQSPGGGAAPALSQHARCGKQRRDVLVRP